MADDGLIGAYLRELRFSISRLPDAEDIVAEAEDHLLEAAERLVAAGSSAAEAQAEAVARFGSASVVSRMCLVQSRQGVAVPTTRTRQAGFAALLAPVLLVLGQWGNVTVARGAGHGVAVAMVVLAFPAFAFGLWGLRTRHGGLGLLGRGALILTLSAPVFSVAAGWAAPLVFIPLVSIAVVVFAIEMLRVSVLPFPPLVMLATGGITGLLALAGAGVVTATGGDAGRYEVLLVVPLALTAVAMAWLGWHLWRESAVDHPGGLRPLSAA